MSTLAEIEAAVEQLPVTQQETLFNFLSQRMRKRSGGRAPASAGKLEMSDLATHAEPMGALTNAAIDQAIYGR